MVPLIVGKPFCTVQYAKPSPPPTSNSATTPIPRREYFNMGRFLATTCVEVFGAAVTGLNSSVAKYACDDRPLLPLLVPRERAPFADRVPLREPAILLCSF